MSAPGDDGMSGEIRQNKATKEWVIFAPARGKRPHDFRQRDEESGPVPPHDTHCPFCPGNEAMLPTVIKEWRDEHGDQWQARVVPNKFPALTPNGSIQRYSRGINIAMQGYGQHEVIVESPRHDQDIATMTPASVRTVIEAYYRRYVELYGNPSNVLILIFRNHGATAGASLQHPHSQVIATGLVPRAIRWREYEAQRYFDELGRCVYCDMLAFELEDKQRIVLQNDSFAAFIPYAAECPFETWIVPRRHQSDFSEIGEAERADLSTALHTILAKLHTRLNNPDYNYTINTAARTTNEPQSHWYLRIRPRLVTRAGFEIGSGMRINPSLPEADAAFLNDDQPR
ncbi:MAG TPA: galactose-1-phosphate uridylyltransferase [Herpetosiphonaceae bacterium]